MAQNTILFTPPVGQKTESPQNLQKNIIVFERVSNVE